MPRKQASDRKYIESKKLSDGLERYRVTLDPPRVPARQRSQWFDNLHVAQAWRDERIRSHEEGTAGIRPEMTLRELADAWIAAANSGAAMTKSRQPYKHSVLRGYIDALERVMLPRLGERTQIGNLRRGTVQAVADRMLAEGLHPNTVRNYITGLRVALRWAVSREWITVNPCDRLEVGSIQAAQARDTVYAPDEVSRLVQAIDHPQSRLLFALAFYTGMRKGELAALRWEDVDLAKGVIHVRRGFDFVVDRENVPASTETLAWPDRGKGAFILPKSRAALRDVPIVHALLPYLVAEDRTQGLVLGAEHNVPFGDVAIDRAHRDWEVAGLSRVTLHEARHTFASLLIAAMAAQGKFNPKMLQVALGHSSITVTYDRYGHLFPGSNEELGAMLNSYLEAGASAV